MFPTRGRVLNERDGGADRFTMTDAALLRVIEAAGIATATLDTEGRIRSSSPSFARTWGRAAEELCDLHLLTLCPDHEQAEVMTALARLMDGSSDLERHDLRVDPGGTEPRVLRLTMGAAVDDQGSFDHVAVVLHDVTVPHRAERRRRRQVVEFTRAATHDPTTGLPNLRAFDAMLASALRRSARTGYPFSLLRVDVDGLASLIDGLPPVEAAELVEIYTARLAQQLRPSDEVCRGDGDSFMVIAEDLGDVQDAAGVAYRLLSTVVEPICVGTKQIRLPMTIGIVVADGSVSADGLSGTADAALAEARTDGVGGFRIIDVRPGLAA
jgi:diguanylate cyclase (GGDEF)-like protein/PAS domain S-box-containing protein